MSKKQTSRNVTFAASTAARRASRRVADAELPERVLILERLREHGVPMHVDDLAHALGVRTPAAIEAFHGRLAAMERDGQLMTNRKGQLCVVAKLDLMTGTVQGHPDGYGFLIVDDGSPDLFLSPKEMHKALHGDRATARQVSVDRRGRPEGVIVDVLRHANREVVGRIYEERGICYLVAEDKRISQDILIPPDMRAGAKPGQVVVAELVEQPAAHREPLAKIVKVLGNYTDPGMEIEIALRKHDLPHEFSPAAKRLAARLPDVVRPTDSKDRSDLTALPLVTIDGETAKDFDDAVYCERTGKGYRLVVAIADVSHYVRDGDGLDRDARERGTSVYFPRRVIPMVPEKLSNALCSLMPEVDRLCMVCDMAISTSGEIRSYRFYPGVMHSRARLTYTQVWDWLSKNQHASSGQANPLGPHLHNLYALYKVLAAARAKRGALDFETIELELRFDERGKIEAIIPAERNEAHKLIEECMLAANVCAADLMLREHQPTLFRVHGGPTPEKLAALKEFLAASGLSLGGGDNPAPRDYAKLLTQIAGRPDFNLLQTVLLRSLQQAIYSPSNVGHFGLGYDAYAHFTSPIRRYPDLLVHRCIKAILAGKRYSPEGSTWSELGVHCSLTERRADEATRDVENWLKCYFMQDRIGEVFQGTVSGVTHFGVFVTLDGLNVDGLVHVTELGDDYFHFDVIHHALNGERSGRRYQLADRISVKIARVDLEASRIDFVLDDTTVARRARLPATKGKRATRR